MNFPSRINYPEIADNSYGVILYLCDVYIPNAGINYSQEDTIEITPDNGAYAEPIISDNGRIMGVNIIESGEGFTERPMLTVKTKTGYNAVLIPILCIRRIGDSAREPEVSNVIQVIDCVGKHPLVPMSV